MVYAVGSRTTSTLPETNMEIQKGAIKTTVLLTEDYLGFHVSLGEGTCPLCAEFSGHGPSRFPNRKSRKKGKHQTATMTTTCASDFRVSWVWWPYKTKFIDLYGLFRNKG